MTKRDSWSSAFLSKCHWLLTTNKTKYALVSTEIIIYSTKTKFLLGWRRVPAKSPHLATKVLYLFISLEKILLGQKPQKRSEWVLFAVFFFPAFVGKKKNPLIESLNFLRLFLQQKMRTHMCMGFPIFDLFLRRKIE